MARQVADRRLTLTAAVRASVIAQAAELARERGVPVSRIVDEILAEYFERAAKSGRQSGRVATVGSEDQDQGA
jgi:post-segregation antitoxin (ccd killing protein)